MNETQPVANARRERLYMLFAALLLAVVSWMGGLAVRAEGRLLVWGDLETTFSSALSHLDNPYESPGFFNPPWAMVLLIPFDPLPLESAALIKTSLYFALLALVIHKHGGRLPALLVVLTSPLAFDASLEINIDWMVCIGLLVPPAYSLPFLFIKPQAAFGYPLSFKPADLLRAGLVGALVAAVAFVIWGNWPQALLDNIRLYETNVLVNIAPMAIVPLPVALLVGLVLLIYGVRRRDPVACIGAGLCVTPYAAPTSVLVLFSLMTARWPRWMLLVSVAIWFVIALIVR